MDDVSDYIDDGEYIDDDNYIDDIGLSPVEKPIDVSDIEGALEKTSKSLESSKIKPISKNMIEENLFNIPAKQKEIKIKQSQTATEGQVHTNYPALPHLDKKDLKKEINESIDEDKKEPKIIINNSIDDLEGKNVKVNKKALQITIIFGILIILFLVIFGYGVYKDKFKSALNISQPVSNVCSPVLNVSPSSNYCNLSCGVTNITNNITIYTNNT